MAVQLDHVIILLPHKDVVQPPTWLTDHFTISPGGWHADGKTENCLILFRDGTYVELIAFIDDNPAKRKGHWWDKPFGVVDFALTTPAALDYPALKARLQDTGTGISYDEPVAGGRRTPYPDRQDLKWKVTFPTGVARGAVPFWCHDVTPRARRVPVTDKNTNHPCGATGVAGVLVKLGDDELARVAPAMTAIVEHEPREDARYPVGTPIDVRGRDLATIRLASISDGDRHEQSLTLVLHTLKKPKPSRIEKHIGDGTVSIHFE